MTPYNPTFDETGIRISNGRRLLWIGDAVASTGFARCTHQTLDVLRKTWDVAVLGLNYLGDPHRYPYPIYPGWPGGDGFGLGRVEHVIASVKPDLVVIQNDPWNIPEYMKRIKDIPVVASMPLDGKNCQSKWLNGLALAIFWTEFGLLEARSGGYTGPAAVVPLGVDLEMYKPVDQLEARRRVGLPEELLDKFIIGNVNRNQPRKRLDLTIEYFAAFTARAQAEDAYLFLFVAPTGEMSYDVEQLMHYYGFKGAGKRLILVQPEMGYGQREETLSSIYSCFDVQLSTTQGEGWGLTTMEGMACGVPQIFPDWSALGEWAKPAGMAIPCYDTAVTSNNRINILGGIPDRTQTVEALHNCYASWKLKKAADHYDVASVRTVLEQHRELGIQLVADPRYRWSSIGASFEMALDTVS